jgi:hypothetical protein
MTSMKRLITGRILTEALPGIVTRFEPASN